MGQGGKITKETKVLHMEKLGLHINNAQAKLVIVIQTLLTEKKPEYEVLNSFIYIYNIYNLLI